LWPGLQVILGILHWVVGRVLVTNGIIKPPADKGSNGRPDAGVWDSIVSFWGYDTLARRMAEDTATAAAASDDATSGTTLAKGLLSDESGSVAMSSSINSGPTPATAAAAASTKPRSPWRIRSIDTLRGACLAIMILVNYGGESYPMLF
jgi:hypothetical protein